MEKCYLCDCTLEDVINETSANHLEHVIPQALGGQLTVRDILCKECGGDKFLGGKIDKPFSDLFAGFTQRLDLKRDRQTNSVPLKGKLTVLENDSVLDVYLKEGVLSTQKPDYKIDHERKKVQVFANKVVAKNYKKKVERDLFTSGEIDSGYSFEIVSDLKAHQEFFGILELPFSVDNKLFEAGFAKIAIEFALSKGVPLNELNHLIDTTNRAIKSEGTLFPYYPIFKPEEIIEYLRTSIDPCYMSHSLVLFSQRQIDENDEETKRLFCFIELFGTFQYFVLLKEGYIGENIDPTTYSQKIINDPLVPLDLKGMSPKDVSIYMHELGLSYEQMEDKTFDEAKKMIEKKYASRNRYVFDYADNMKTVVDRILMDSMLNHNDIVTSIIPKIVHHFYKNPEEDDFHIQLFRSRYLDDERNVYSIIPEILDLYEEDKAKFTEYTLFKFSELEAFVNANESSKNN